MPMLSTAHVPFHNCLQRVVCLVQVVLVLANDLMWLSAMQKHCGLHAFRAALSVFAAIYKRFERHGCQTVKKYCVLHAISAKLAVFIVFYNSFVKQFRTGAPSQPTSL